MLCFERCDIDKFRLHRSNNRKGGDSVNPCGPALQEDLLLDCAFTEVTCLTRTSFCTQSLSCCVVGVSSIPVAMRNPSRIATSSASLGCCSRSSPSNTLRPLHNDSEPQLHKRDPCVRLHSFHKHSCSPSSSLSILYATFAFCFSICSVQKSLPN